MSEDVASFSNISAHKNTEEPGAHESGAEESGVKQTEKEREEGSKPTWRVKWMPSLQSISLPHPADAVAGVKWEKSPPFASFRHGADWLHITEAQYMKQDSEAERL
ncbi:hypothetical protein IFM47457_09342 [Aspergillus lentulus]|nr:hypothetical protein IFM47457_09342 [Aspergillus lentulus]